MNPQNTPTGTPQQQAIERLKTAVNVLVTVSNSPSVDQLAAAIGFTLTLNKLGKHATAVFSGDVPSTIEFLKPEATIEKDTNSLRDFIVSLDKSKADKLRYKVEENVVKIFITPYRTSLSEKDLNFSQGDFNVDAVVALGISEREQLDQAIISHGRILHDATVITVSAGNNASSLGAINWQDNSASSLCEMLVGISDVLQPGLLDNQIATAYLTGIVAETERFRNQKTTPRVMTLAAQLMAGGANQQLIASSLEQVTEVALKPTATSAEPAEPEEPSKSTDGSLTIKHDVRPVALGSVPDTKPEAESNFAPVELTDSEIADEEPKESETAQIAIDEHGTLALAPKEDNFKTRHRIIEPLPAEAEKDTDDAAAVPNPFTANMTADGEDEPSTDPLTAAINPDTATMLSHDTGDKTSPTPDFALPAPVSAEPLPPALDTNTIRDIEKTFDSRHIAQDPHSTLDEIEQVVDSPHLSATGENLDSARDAVQNAIQAAPYDPNRPEPLQRVNSTDAGLPLGTAPTATDPVLAGLGLTDTISEPSQSILPPPPTETVQPPAEEPAEQPPSGGPPPVPPPLFPMQ